MATENTGSAGDEVVPISVVDAVERVRIAESRLARRRQTDCGPSENARSAMRFVLEQNDEGRDVTPTAIASHLGVSTASVTGMLDRLHEGGLVRFVANPDDRRSKLVVPQDRATDADEIDPLTARIRELAQALTPAEINATSRFLAKVADAVDRECVR